MTLIGLLSAKALTPETMHIEPDGRQMIVRRQSMEPDSSLVEENSRVGAVPITPKFQNGHFEDITEAEDNLGAPIIVALAQPKTYETEPIAGWSTSTPQLVTLMPSDHDGGMTTANGGVFCALRNKDMAGEWTKAEISQEISDLTPGKKYRLAFKEASEDSPSKEMAEIEILLDGATSDDPLACKHDPSKVCDKPDWHQAVSTISWADIAFNFTANEGVVKFTIRNRTPRTDHADHEPTLLLDDFDISDA